MYNAAKLAQELKAAGLPVTGTSSDGWTDYFRALTVVEAVTAAAVIAAHDPYEAPAPTLEDRIAELEKRNAALEAALTRKGVLTAVDLVDLVSSGIAVDRLTCV